MNVIFRTPRSIYADFWTRFSSAVPGDFVAAEWVNKQYRIYVDLQPVLISLFTLVLLAYSWMAIAHFAGGNAPVQVEHAFAIFSGVSSMFNIFAIPRSLLADTQGRKNIGVIEIASLVLCIAGFGLVVK